MYSFAKSADLRFRNYFIFNLKLLKRTIFLIRKLR